MSARETFEIAMETGEVTGTLAMPAKASAKARVGAVLICHGISPVEDEVGGFLDELTSALVNARLAVARFEHRCAELILEDYDAHCAGHDLDDALAVHRWLVDRPEVDTQRVGVLGFAFGAIAAVALGKRLESINRLGLVAPVTARYVREAFAANGEDAKDEDHTQRLPAAYVPSLEDVDSAKDAAFYNRATLIVQGAADRVIPPAASLEYLHALEVAGRPVEHVFIARSDHAFSHSASRALCMDRIAKFFAGMEVVASTGAAKTVHAKAAQSS